MRIPVLNQAIAGLALLLSGVCAVSAGSFKLSPLRVTLSPAIPVSAITVTNSGTEPTVVQLETLSWSQQGEQDVYSPTRDIIATPPIFTIPVGGAQVVRLGLRRVPDAQRELTYRVFMQEAPSAPKPGVTGMNMILRMGVPVFVAPTVIQANAVAWKIYRTPNGRLELSLTNNGNAHLQLLTFILADVAGKELGKQTVTAYVLPGQSRKLVVKDIPAPAVGVKLRVLAHTDGGDLDSDLLEVLQK